MDYLRKDYLNYTANVLSKGVFVFLFASILLFLAIESMPEDPISLRMKNPDPERIEAIRSNLGLDDPVPVRYFRMLGDFVVFDWGKSLITDRPVMTDVKAYLPATIELSALAVMLGVSVGCGLTLFGFSSGNRYFLIPSKAIALMGLSVPIFWVGLILIIIFAVSFGVLPAGGRIDFSTDIQTVTGFLLIDSLLTGNPATFWSALKHLLLPAATLSLYPMALSAGALEMRLKDPAVERLVLNLRARGYGPVRIWAKHILRLLSGPIITITGTQAGALMGGAVLTETVFSWPGFGRYLIDGVLNRDLFVIQNGLLASVLLALFIVSISDMLARLANHKLKENSIHATA